MARLFKAAGLASGVAVLALSIMPAAGQPVLPAGIYVGAEAGFGLHAANSVSDHGTSATDCFFCGVEQPLSIGNSGIFGGKIGINLNPTIRTELNVDFLSSATAKIAFRDDPTSRQSGNLTSLAVLFNGYLDFPTLLGPFRPFAMAGIGFASNNLGKLSGTLAGRPASIGSISHTGFAYDIGAGLSYPVAPRLTADLQYRYMDLGAVQGGSTVAINGTARSSAPLRTGSIAVHAITIGVRYDL